MVGCREGGHGTFVCGVYAMLFQWEGTVPGSAGSMMFIAGRIHNTVTVPFLY